MRILIHVLVAPVLVLTIAGCMMFGDVSVPERITVTGNELPALESGDFLQASLLMQPQSTKMALRFESEAGIDRQVWTFRVQQAMTGISGRNPAVAAGSETYRYTGTGADAFRGGGNEAAQGAGNEIILAEHLNRITEQAHRVAWNGHVFYFVSTASDAAPGGPNGYQPGSVPDQNREPRRFHTVYIADENGRGVASFRTGEVEPVQGARGQPRSLPAQPLQFDVVVTGNGPWVLYRDRGGIYARQVRPGGPNALPGSQPGMQQQRGETVGSARLAGDRGHVAFGEPILVSRAELPAGEFQLVARADHNGYVHVIWTDLADAGRNRHNLWYCRFDPDTGNACRRPLRLTRFANRDAVNLMVQGDEVYLSWTDNRFAKGLWTRRNTAKLFVVKSSDGGQSFGAPVSIHPPGDTGEHAGFAMTMPAQGGGVLIFWSRQWRNNDMLDHDLHVGLLRPDMETLMVGENMLPGNQLYQTLTESLLAHHRSMASQ